MKNNNGKFRKKKYTSLKLVIMHLGTNIYLLVPKDFTL